MPALSVMFKTVSSDCNLDCSYCYFRETLYGGRGSGSPRHRISQAMLEKFIPEYLPLRLGQEAQGLLRRRGRVAVVHLPAATLRPAFGLGTLVALYHTLPEERLSAMRTGNGRILVVEDDSAIRHLVLWTLQDEGLAVDGAADGATAIRYLADHRPALLILDLMMPHADGHQVARALRSSHGRDTPILLLTAAGDARGLARRIGADRYLAKPFDLDQLIALVRGLLEPAQFTTLAGRADESDLDTAADG